MLSSIEVHVVMLRGKKKNRGPHGAILRTHYLNSPIFINEQVRRFEVSMHYWWIPVMQIIHSSGLQRRINSS